MKVNRLGYFDVYFPFQDRLCNATGVYGKAKTEEFLIIEEIHFGESEYVVWSIPERGAPTPEVIEFECALHVAILQAVRNQEALR